MPRSPRIEFYRHQLGEAEATAWRSVLDTLFLTLGPQVAAFEKALGEFLVRGRVVGKDDAADTEAAASSDGLASALPASVPHVIGTSCCSMGLLLALRAHDIGPGDEIITTPMTFASTTNAIMHLGARPVLVDVEPDTGLIDVEAVRVAIGPRTKGVMPVHLYGQLADMRGLRALADRHALFIVEDSAHGVEMERDGVRPGDLGTCAVFSFYATKNLTSGDGGAIATRDARLADRLRRLRNHGVSKAATERHGAAYQHWDLVELGYKANLTDLDAAILLAQMPPILEKRARREALAKRYEQRLAEAAPALTATGSAHAVPWVVARRGTSSHHLFTIHPPVPMRDLLLARLGSLGIGTAVNYRAIHTLTYLVQALQIPRGTYPVAEEIGDRTISLPLYPSLTEAEQDQVVEAVARSIDELRETR